MLDDFTPIEQVSELQIIDRVEGTGDAVAAGATVTVDYIGAIAATGHVFQSSKDFGKPITFGLGQVIQGWGDGIPGMKVGGTRRLIIPAEMAYGSRPPYGSGIPADAPLVFDVTLHAIET
ncbi:MAG: FKBP-type peptidyl-prolyl cis-trans isomerase [Candidatus Saccharimonadales bacterium]